MNRHIEALVNVDLELQGPTTIATVTPLSPSQYALRGQMPLRPELSAGLVGVGIARCRSEDAYEASTGIYLATIRAHRQLLDQIEERALASVETTTQRRQRLAGEEFAAALNGVIGAFREVLDAAGIGGDLIMEDR